MGACLGLGVFEFRASPLVWLFFVIAFVRGVRLYLVSRGFLRVAERPGGYTNTLSQLYSLAQAEREHLPCSVGQRTPSKTGRPPGREK